MTKEQIAAEITKVQNNKFLPDAVKAIKIKKLTAEMEAATGAPAGKVHFVKPAASAKAKPEPKKANVYIDIERKKYVLIDTKTNKKWANEFFDTEDEAKYFAEQNGLNIVKNEKPAKGGQKPAKPKKPVVVHKFKGKNVKKELNEEDCAELLKAVSERRRKAAKSEKKSKSKPVMEKVAANVATAVKQAVKNVSAADIKDDPKGEINKFERIAKAAKTFLAEMRSILGEDYDKDSIEGEFKDIHDLIKELKKKYNK